ncbi:predicted protein [Botrytis cinerea T4]|uniref:Uncharacterized protein n=1 Tax=Botryotinia fuckeliana (strain T4) TaxID=999810 RepID=G2YV75_BOTF4|nr:predicted protein [Botrytis cinerea T4]
MILAEDQIYSATLFWEHGNRLTLHIKSNVSGSHLDML